MGIDGWWDTEAEAVTGSHEHANGQRLIGAMQEREEAAVHTVAVEDAYTKGAREALDKVRHAMDVEPADRWVHVVDGLLADISNAVLKEDTVRECPKCGSERWGGFGPNFSMRCCYTCKHEWPATTARENSQSCTCDHLPAGDPHAEGCPLLRRFPPAKTRH